MSTLVFATPNDQGETGLPQQAATGQSPRTRFLRSFKRHRLAMFGTGVLVFLICMAIFAPFVLPSPYTIDLMNISQPPSTNHWLGTDEVGRDQLARLVHGARVSLSVGIVAVAIYTIIGLLLGGIAGYFGGKIDSVIMRFADTIMCFPSLIIIITIVSLVGPSIYNVMLVIGLLNWPQTARLFRGQVLSLREREFVEASRSVGVPDWTILYRHIMPNAIFPIIVSSTFGIASAILTEAGLSFLGLGVQQPTASWGNMLSSAQSLTTVESMPWLWLAPGLSIITAVVCINFVGDGLRDALDPHAQFK